MEEKNKETEALDEIENKMARFIVRQLKIDSITLAYAEPIRATELTEAMDFLERTPQFKKIREDYTDKQDLEKFTRLVIDKRVAMDLITNEEVKDFIKYNYHCDKYDFIVPLTEEEFNFIREMIKKYE